MPSDLHSDPHQTPPSDAALDAHFTALRASLSDHNAPRGVEKELMDAFAAARRRARWYHRFSTRLSPHLSPTQWGLAGSAAVLLLVLPLALPLMLRAPQRLDVGPSLLQRDGGAAFIALDSLERIAGESDAHVLETDVQRSSLAALGVPVTPENAGDTVRAEMLVGADGTPLALRLSDAR